MIYFLRLLFLFDAVKKDMFYRIIKQKNMKTLDICAKVLYNNIDLSMRLCT